MSKLKVGKLRLLPKGTEVWSINNQANIIITKDTIVEIKHTVFGNDDYVYVQPKQVIFNMVGFIPTLIGLGCDEWGILYSQSKKYNLPKPTLITFSYGG